MSREALPTPWKGEVLDYDRVFALGEIPTPSRAKDLVTLPTELSYRFLGCHLIQRAGRLLKMCLACAPLPRPQLIPPHE